MTISDEPDQGRLIARFRGEVAGHLEYQQGRNRIVLVHTEVDDAYEGRGIGGALVRAALERARSENADVVPRCPFAASWLERHPAYQDLVAG